MCCVLYVVKMGKLRAGWTFEEEAAVCCAEVRPGRLGKKFVRIESRSAMRERGREEREDNKYYVYTATSGARAACAFVGLRH